MVPKIRIFMNLIQLIKTLFYTSMLFSRIIIRIIIKNNSKHNYQGIIKIN